MSFLRSAADHLKNFPGYRTSRHIVVFLVDDYGNVRLDSVKARNKMSLSGLNVSSRFDTFDSLETREDLEILFETLSSVTDTHGHHAVFTPFAVTRNIDFERMAEEGYARGHFEILPVTFDKLESDQPAAYDGSWQMWQEGMEKGLLSPQFHGREHLNLKVFNEKLVAKDPSLFVSLKNRSFAGISGTKYSTISYTAAFDFWDFSETREFQSIISEGLNDFRQIFGRNAEHFNAPGAACNHIVYPWLKAEGVRYLDTPWLHKEHLGKGKYKRSLNSTGHRTPEGLIRMVRNVVFEPGDGSGRDWASFTMRQIDAAFRMSKPAIISSHRVNFCGHIDPANRANGIGNLRSLLKAIVRKYPDVEFLSSEKLGMIIEKQS
jgi:hypothetical protein